MKTRKRNKIRHSLSLSHIFFIIYGESSRWASSRITMNIYYLIINVILVHYLPTQKKQYHLACLISHSFIPQVSYFKNPLTKTLIIDNMLVGQEIRDCLYHDTSQIWLPNRFLKRCFILFSSYVFFPSHEWILQDFT